MSSRTDIPSYNQTPAWLHEDQTIAEERLAVNNAVEKLEEFFVWSNDVDGQIDKANEILKSSDELQALLTKLVAKSIGTGMIYSTLADQINTQIVKSVREFVVIQLEKGDD